MSHAPASGHRRRRSRLAAALTVATMTATAAVASVVASTPAQAVTLPTDTSDCTVSTYYQVANPTSGVGSQLNQATFDDEGNFPFTPVGPATDASYNAIAIDPRTNAMYGIATVAGVDADGKDMAVGTVVYIDRTTGKVYSLGTVIRQFNSAAFGPDGTMYLTRSGNVTELVKLDVDTMTTQTVTESEAAGPADLTYKDGYLWGREDNNGRIVRVDPDTGAVTKWTVPGLPTGSGGTNGSTGGAFTFGNGNLGLILNGGVTTQLQVTNPSSAEPTFTIVANYASPVAAGTDGASCISTATDLAITKKASSSTIDPDGTVTWTLTVTNNGPNPSSGWVVKDTVPEGYTDVKAGSTGGTVNGNTVVYTGGPLAVGASREVTISAKAPFDVQCLTNSATVVGNEADTDTSNDTSSADTCVNPAPALVVKKSSDPATGGEVKGGDTVTYTVTGEDTGNTVLDPVTLTDDMSKVLDHAKLVDGSLKAQVDGQDVDAPTVSGTTLTWTGRLGPGQKVTVTYAVTVDQDVPGGTKIVNHVVGSGENPDNPGTNVPSNCVDGTEDGCTTEETVPPTPTTSPTPTGGPTLPTWTPVPSDNGGGGHGAPGASVHTGGQLADRAPSLVGPAALAGVGLVLVALALLVVRRRRGRV